MATLHEVALVENSAARVWDALADFQAVDRRVAPGFVKKSVPDGQTRVVTFASGVEAREELVASDPERFRLVYKISSERLRHYNAALEVTAVGQNACRVRWTVDLLPDVMAPYIREQMGIAISVMKATLERA